MIMSKNLDIKLTRVKVKSGIRNKMPSKEFKDILKQAVSYGMTYVQFKHDLPISAKQRKGVAKSFISRYSSQPENLWDVSFINVPEIETYYFYSLDPTKTETEIMLWNGIQISLNVSSRFAFEVILAKDISKILQIQIKNYKVSNLLVTNAPPGSLIQKKYLPKFALYAFINAQVEDGEIKQMENLEWKRQD